MHAFDDVILLHDDILAIAFIIPASSPRSNAQGRLSQGAGVTGDQGNPLLIDLQRWPSSQPPALTNSSARTGGAIWSTPHSPCRSPPLRQVVRDIDIFPTSDPRRGPARPAIRISYAPARNNRAHYGVVLSGPALDSAFIDQRIELGLVAHHAATRLAEECRRA